MEPPMQELQSPQQLRQRRISSIKLSMQDSPIMKKNTSMIEQRIKQKDQRKQSLKLEDTTISEAQMEKLIQMEKEASYSAGKFLDKYELGEKVGEGAHGVVRKCYCRTTRQLFAVKTMTMDDEHILFLKKNFKEIKSLKHPNVIEYHYMFLDRGKNVCHLVMDYDGSPKLTKFHSLPELEVKNIMFQLIDTLAFIHSRNICHRDIKPDNILYDQTTKRIKIIDFGISRKLVERGAKKEMLTITGTLYYRAPEMFLGGGYDEKVDLWAAGVTLYQMINNGKTPFECEYLSKTIENITKGQVQFDDQIWGRHSKFVKDLVVRLLKKSTERLTAVEAKQHLWFIVDNDNVEAPELHKSVSAKPRPIIADETATDTKQLEGALRGFRLVKKFTMNPQPAVQNEDDPEKKQKKKTANLLQKWVTETLQQDVQQQQCTPLPSASLAKPKI